VRVGKKKRREVMMEKAGGNGKPSLASTAAQPLQDSSKCEHYILSCGCGGGTPPQHRNHSPTNPLPSYMPVVWQRAGRRAARGISPGD
jgi:hypothetical protein